MIFNFFSIFCRFIINNIYISLIVNEEVDKAPKNGYKKGDSVKLNANHMAGMKGAKAKIDDVKNTTVYMADYKSTENDKTVKNHK